MKPTDLTAIVDTREQKPWHLNMKMEKAALATGDYTIKGLESYVCVERKSLSDLVMCVGRERERFEKEMQRMLAYQRRYLVVEATWEDIEIGKWRSKVSSNAVYGSLVGWAERGIHVCLQGDAHGCQRFVEHLFYMIARRRLMQLRALEKAIAPARGTRVSTAP
jgi:ERCC4-type nuclease